LLIRIAAVVDPDPDDTDSVDPDPDPTDSVDPDSVDPDSVDPDPDDPDPDDPDSVDPDPDDPDPDDPDSVDPDSDQVSVDSNHTSARSVKRSPISVADQTDLLFCIRCYRLPLVGSVPHLYSCGANLDN
jgi:hypothetical protein